MSQEIRNQVVRDISSFAHSSEMDDLDTPLPNTNSSVYKTKTSLISMLLPIVSSYKIDATSVVSDHSPDLCLGPGGHQGGYAIDFWVEDEGQRKQLIMDVARGKFTMVRQMGLGGSTQMYYDEAVALAQANNGPTIFKDNDEDHIHLGAKEEG